MLLRREAATELTELLSGSPAVVLVGPRQAGKTTLALQVAEEYNAVYLDLESPADRAKLAEPELYLDDHREQLVILDEIHRAPGLFETLRGVIDRRRREGRRASQFLLLGSASIDLLRQSGETLAGRVAYLDLAPLSVAEVDDHDRLWERGGFPDSYLAGSAKLSARWRQDFVRTYLERDIPQFGPRIPAETLRRFWTMLAHHQGSVLNAAMLARNLGVDGKTIGRYLDLLCDLLLARRLPPWTSSTGKRLVRSPKVYLRDSGIVHALLGLGSKEAVLSHPIVGMSWEGFVVENLLTALPDGVQPSFYRSVGGAEVDLVLTWPAGETWVIEVKRSLSPSVQRGFHSAYADVGATRGFVVYPGQEQYRATSDVDAVSIGWLRAEISGRG